MLNASEVTSFQGLFFDELAAKSDRTRPGFHEICQCFTIDSPGGHQPDLWQGAFECFQIGGSPDIRRKQLDDIGSGFPGRHDLRRSVRTGHDHFVVSQPELDDVQIDARGNKELRPRENRDASGFRIEDRSGPQQDFVSQFLSDGGNDFNDAGSRESDFDNIDSTLLKCTCNTDELIAGGCSNNRDNPTTQNSLQIFMSAHAFYLMSTAKVFCGMVFRKMSRSVWVQERAENFSAYSRIH